MSDYWATCYSNIVQRTENPKHPSYRFYGARGIRLWEPWRQDFNRFKADLLREIGERPPGINPRTGLSLYQLDRINGSLGYQPGNLRWVTVLANQRNKRPRRLKFTKRDLALMGLSSELPPYLFVNADGQFINTAYHTL
jgi:hypothetical protein